MGEKIAVWLWNCFDAAGLTVTFLAFINLEPVEKAILFTGSTIFLGYRVYHLHLDAKKKEIDIEDKRFDLTDKKDKHSQSK